MFPSSRSPLWPRPSSVYTHSCQEPVCPLVFPSAPAASASLGCYLSFSCYLCACGLAITQGLWEPQGRNARDSARIQLPTQSNPFLVHSPCNCHKGAPGASPVGGKLRLYLLLVLLSTIITEVPLLCGDPEPGLNQIRWVRGRMKTGEAWQRIQVPRLESQSRRRGQL